MWETQLAFWGDHLVGNIHHRDSLAVYIAQRRGGDASSRSSPADPASCTRRWRSRIGTDGDLLVEQLDGQALRFRLDGPDFDPVFVEQFRVDTVDAGQRLRRPRPHAGDQPSAACASSAAAAGG